MCLLTAFQILTAHLEARARRGRSLSTSLATAWVSQWPFPKRPCLFAPRRGPCWLQIGPAYQTNMGNHCKSCVCWPVREMDWTRFVHSLGLPVVAFVQLGPISILGSKSGLNSSLMSLHFCKWNQSQRRSGVVDLGTLGLINPLVVLDGTALVCPNFTTQSFAFKRVSTWIGKCTG